MPGAQWAGVDFPRGYNPHVQAMRLTMALTSVPACSRRRSAPFLHAKLCSSRAQKGPIRLAALQDPIPSEQRPLIYYIARVFDLWKTAFKFVEASVQVMKGSVSYFHSSGFLGFSRGGWILDCCKP